MRNQDERRSRIQFVAWNVEKGKRWELLEKCLDVPAIRTADVLCLNEVDDGMARSGNRRIAFEIGNRLGMRVVFGPTFKEFTKGNDEEQLVPGENTTAVQGNAILSRLPILESKNLGLPVCHDPTKGDEKREGGRHALIVRVDCGNGRSVTVANTHLEVFTSRGGRQRQIRFLVEQLGSGTAIIAGDLNTNTFDRGSAVHTVRSLIHLLRSDVKSRVMSPWIHEPLFRELRKAGFSWDDFNDTIPTCSVDLASLEEKRNVPGFIRDRILAKCRVLPLRLDFIACRGLHALSPGRTITELPCHPSDHLPISSELWF